MEKAMFPLKYLKVIQSENQEKSLTFGHKDKKENVYAPFTGIIRKVYKARGNFVWLESIDKVRWADGAFDFMTMLTGHDENVESLYVGKIVQQGEAYYTQGGNGSDFDYDVYIEVGRGTFSGNGWGPDPDGKWIIDNPVSLADAFFVDKEVVIEEPLDLKWKIL